MKALSCIRLAIKCVKIFSTVYNLASHSKTNSTEIKSLLLCFDFPTWFSNLKYCHKYTMYVLITEYLKGLLFYSCFKTEANLGNLGIAHFQSCFQIWFFFCVCRKARQLKKPHSLGYHGNIVDLWWVNCLSRIATFYDETYLCRFAALWCHKKRTDDKMKKTYMATLILYHVLSLGCLQYSYT